MRSIPLFYHIFGFASFLGTSHPGKLMKSVSYNSQPIFDPFMDPAKVSAGVLNVSSYDEATNSHILKVKWS